MNMKTLAALVAALFVAAASNAAEPRHADHEALRAMLKTGAEALNSRNFDALKPVLADKFTMITMDQKKLTTLDEVKSYYDGFFTGDKPLLKKVTLNPKADDLTQFLDEDAGVCTGTSMDTYEFTDGDTREMASRWSAVVVKKGGKWKLASLHIGVNAFDNPMISGMKDGMPKIGLIGAVIGLVLGLGLSKAFCSSKKA